MNRLLFAVIAIDKQDALALRLATRESHFAYVCATGVVKIGGPFLDSQGEMNGSLIVFEAANLEAAKSWHADDPYVKAGLFASSEVRPWKATFNPIEAKL